MTDDRHDAGGPIYLRPLREEDIDERYLAWFADPYVTRFLEARNLTRQDSVDYLRQGNETRSYFMHAICLSDSDLHVGNLKIGSINRRHLISDMVTVIGDRGAWGKGYAREAIRIGIKVAFDVHKIRKLSASIDSANTGSIKAYTAAGFEIETALKNHFMHGDDLTDKVYVACFNPDFQPSGPDPA